jgi:hypothetical protein
MAFGFLKWNFICKFTVTMRNCSVLKFFISKTVMNTLRNEDRIVNRISMI